MIGIDDRSLIESRRFDPSPTSPYPLPRQQKQQQTSHRRRTWRWKKMHRNEKSNTWPHKDNPLNSFSLVCNCGVKVDRPIRDDVIETPPKKKRNWSILISLTLIDTGPRHLYIESFPNQTTGITTSRRTDDRGWVWIVEMFHGKGIMNQSKSLNW